MKKKLFKKVLTLAVAGAMVVGMTVPAMADTPSYELDESKLGSITIYKYDMTSANYTPSYNGNGEEDEEIESTLAGYEMEGIMFKYLRLGDVYQYEFTDSSTGEVEEELVYSIPDWLVTLLNDSDYCGTTLLGSAAYNGTYYTSDQIQNAFNALVKTTAGQDQLYSHMSSGTEFDDKTDGDGYATASDLSVGLYLIVETGVSPNVTVTTTPFLVSVPMTNADGDGWLYDIICYPKNETDEELQPDKEVRVQSSEDDEYSDCVSATTGDILEYSIGMTIGKISTESTWYSSIVATDNLADGLAYVDGSISVSFYASEEAYNHGDSSDAIVSEWNSSYYTFANGVFTVTDEGLEEINTNAPDGSVADGSSIYSGYTDLYMVITYEVEVDDAASLVWGDNGNINTVTITWERTNGEENKLDDAAIVFYYGIDLTKYFDGDVVDDYESSVIFTLQRTEGTDTTDVYAVAGEDGYYYICDAETSGATTEFTPNSDGMLYIYGMDGSYTASNEGGIVASHTITFTLTEIQTYAGYNLLDEPVIIEITSASATYTSGYYNEGNDSSDVDYEDWVDGYWTIDSESSAKIITKNESEESDATWTSATGTTDSSKTSVNATVLLEINNTKGFTLPLTGGMGTMLVVIIGAVIICLAVVVGNRSKKRKAA